MVVKFRVRQKVAVWLVNEVEVYADSEEEARKILSDACSTDEEIETGDECGRITVLDKEICVGNYDSEDYSIL